MNLNILLIGEEAPGIQILRYLTASSHNLVGVLAKPHKDKKKRASVWQVAQNFGVKTWPAEKVKLPSFSKIIRDAQVDLILNVHSLYLIHSEILISPKIGSFNLHPGPLPHYAGLNTPSWALYRGENEYGVTLHQMVPEIDAGPIVSKATFPITDKDTGLTLTIKCVKYGLPLIHELLDLAAEDPGQIPLLPQNLDNREYFGREIPENGRLRWSWPAHKIYDFIRACDYHPYRSPWKSPKAQYAGQAMGILKAKLTYEHASKSPGYIGNISHEGAIVASGDEWILITHINKHGQIRKAAEIFRTGQYLQDGL